MAERKDVEAALAAHRELGRDYEPEIIDAFLDRIENRLAKSEPPLPAVQPRRGGSITPLALGSIGAGVGSTAIATIHHQGWVAVIAWIAITVINLGYARAWRR